MNRLIKVRLLYMFLAAIMMVAVVGCEEDIKWTMPDTSLEPVTPAVFITDAVMPQASEVFIPGDQMTIQGTGFNKFDVFIFRSVPTKAEVQDTKYYQAKIAKLEEAQVTIAIPKSAELRSYEVVLKRWNQEQVLGTVTLYTAHFPIIEDVAGKNIKGRVFCDKTALANVVVSDGISVTKTDANGVYYLTSTKKMGYVFISLPSGYNYKTASGEPAFPLMHQRFTQEDIEQHDFELTEVKGGNVNHTMLVFTDLHLADKKPNTSGNYVDLDQFRGEFIPDITAEMAQYTNVYALCLGDITWDAFWYKNMSSLDAMTDVRYQLPNYKQLMKAFPCPIFNVIGNHDNDPKQIGDINTEEQFKREIAPSYYSFNIGDVHYIVLDNDQYEAFNGGDRDETVGLAGTSDPQKWQMAWLEADLSYVDKSKKIVIAMHAPLTSGALSPSVILPGGSQLLSLLAGYNVEIFAGHTHTNYTNVVPDNPTVREHTIGAVCGTWWFNVKSNNGTGNNGKGAYPMCKDGSPSGYSVFSFAGTSLNWYYKGLGLPKTEQFAIYDMNYVKDEYKRAVGAKQNEVLVNVWNWNSDCTVTITENDQPLTVSRESRMDPVHYTWQKDVLEPEHAPGQPNGTYTTRANAHMFSAIAKVPGSVIKVSVVTPSGTYQKEITRVVPSSLPAEWVFEKNVGNKEFETDNAMPATIGKSFLGYVSNCPKELDINNKIARKVGGTGEPYITGGWPGDYWLFTTPNAKVAAGGKIHIDFYTRSSGSGMKYWTLEYYDDGWKPAGDLITETVVGLGEVMYTHAMSSDGKTNQHVSQTITFTKAINDADMLIRFRCMANWQANGTSGALVNPNGGTHRISSTEGNLTITAVK